MAASQCRLLQAGPASASGHPDTEQVLSTPVSGARGRQSAAGRQGTALGPRAALLWHRDFHFRAGTSLPLPARERLGSGPVGEGPAGRKGLSPPWGLAHCLADGYKRGTAECSQGASGHPSTGVEEVSHTRTVHSSFQCV